MKNSHWGATRRPHIGQARKNSYAVEERFPCDALTHLDKRYRTKYQMSMIENLESIRDAGIGKFLLSEKSLRACPECGGTICVHKGYCFDCRRQRDVPVQAETSAGAVFCEDV